MIPKFLQISLFPVFGFFAQSGPMLAQSETPPPPPVFTEVSPQTQNAPPLDDETLAALEIRYAALKSREAAALARFEPAGKALLAELEDALQTGIAPDLLEWEESSFAWFASKIATANPQAGLPMPGRNARLAVTMMRMQLDFSVPRGGGLAPFLLNKDAPVLQVARAGSPSSAILWVPDLGYLKLPTEYVAPYIDRSDLETPMQIGRVEN